MINKPEQPKLGIPQFAMVASLIAIMAICGRADASGITIGRNRQLFVDDYLIASKSNVTLTLHQPEKRAAGPVIRSDKPWEAGITLYGSVIYDEQAKIYKTWYRAQSDTTYICYATSTDGISWSKPELNVKPFGGSTANNIVVGGSGYYIDGFSVIKDANDPDPNRRYKMLTYGQITGHGSGAAAMVSPDGINWSNPINSPLTPTGDVISMYYDTGLKKYVGLLKQYIGGKRSRTISYSDDFVNWSAPIPLLVPDALDSPTTHFYSQVGYMYQGMRIGYVSILDTANEKINGQLVTSRDGLTWDRYRERIPFMDNGPAGTFDSGMLIPGGSGLIERDGEIWIYYGGFNVDHNGVPIGNEGDVPAAHIGVATLRQDGFVSVDADANGGTLLTQPLVLSGHRLLINANANGGRILAELLDANGAVIPGYGIDSAIAFSGDSLNASLGWGVAIDEALIGQTVQIRFYLEDASLYSFQLTNVPEPATLGLLGFGAFGLLRRRRK